MLYDDGVKNHSDK
jgi:hypothetical protein